VVGGPEALPYFIEGYKVGLSTSLLPVMFRARPWGEGERGAPNAFLCYLVFNSSCLHKRCCCRRHHHSRG
jgi:hypothetical protein